MLSFLGISPLKLAVACGAILVVLASIFGAFSYVRSLTRELASTQSQLAVETQLRERTQAELTLVRAAQLKQIQDIKTLDALNTASAVAWGEVEREVETINTKGPADALAADLNRLNRAANGMLRKAAGAGDR
ncbi:hypothetical protein [Ancylobacter rudongensis]|uniref:Uncharacterized protein n=1 Tax=Ancylobacter rudongensis TaxID=177413 RepID=A0A1G4UPW9_9HYPH|nr:hypothetical protein [Ancylobacter rudongensis]SCW95688.1 hypothetical protein SAMN05660859_0092 [Ancylobacter rudongensis]